MDSPAYISSRFDSKIKWNPKVKHFLFSLKHSALSLAWDFKQSITAESTYLFAHWGGVTFCKAAPERKLWEKKLIVYSARPHSFFCFHQQLQRIAFAALKKIQLNAQRPAILICYFFGLLHRALFMRFHGCQVSKVSLANRLKFPFHLILHCEWTIISLIFSSFFLWSLPKCDSTIVKFGTSSIV